MTRNHSHGIMGISQPYIQPLPGEVEGGKLIRAEAVCSHRDTRHSKSNS